MILGITGTIGAGKGAVVDYLVQHKGFAHYSMRDFLMNEIERRGLPTNRTSTRRTGNELRALHGTEYLARIAYEAAVAEGGDALIESVRATGEAEFLTSHGAFLLAVDADQKLRYERITKRGQTTDLVDFDTWVIQEEQELHSTDPNGMNVSSVMKMADLRIENNGTLSELHEQIEAVLGKING